MIRVNYYGAMGNQMFEYAYARALAERFDDHDIVINQYFNFLSNAANGFFYGTPNQLLRLRLNKNVREMNRLSGTLLAMKDFIPFAFDTLFRVKISQEGYKKRTARGIFRLINLTITYYEPCDTVPEKKIITGIFQSGRFSEEIRPILLEEFKVKDPPSAENVKLLEEIRSCNSVAVHIRRGDFLSRKWWYANVCGEDYYRRAMKYVAEHTENPVFYVFSNTADEVEWIRNNYKLDADFNVRYITLNNPVHEDFRLMYSCKHCVMPNSTLSWWASYMIENEDKIVVAPDIWYKLKYSGTVDVHRDEMVRIPPGIADKR